MTVEYGGLLEYSKDKDTVDELARGECDLFSMTRLS
jgi:hypothetical protein